jgi:hypothetical protein
MRHVHILPDKKVTCPVSFHQKQTCPSIKKNFRISRHVHIVIQNKGTCPRIIQNKGYPSCFLVGNFALSPNLSSDFDFELPFLSLPFFFILDKRGHVHKIHAKKGTCPQNSQKNQTCPIFS